MAPTAVAGLSIQPRLGATATAAPGRTIRVAARTVGRGRRRCSMVVRAGGVPSTNVLILAFVLPFSLFVGTLLTAARVADDLDERFIREMEVNNAILEENKASDEVVDDKDDDDEAEDDVVQPAAEEEEEEEEQVLVTATTGAPSRTRNRPKREI